MEELAKLPKIELHLHLDCSLSYEVVHRIDSSITRTNYLETFVAPPKCHDLADYLRRAGQHIALMQTTDQLRWVTLDLFDQLAADNVIYAEVRFAPLLHQEKGLTAAQIVETVDQAVAEGIRQSGVEARIILCTLRHFDEAQSMATVRLVDRFKGSHVVAFDIAADEAGYPIDAHKKAFRFAQENHFHITAHAGEARGAESVWETLEHFRPSRLGHGVRSIEDDRLVDHLREQGIHLEICPTSNVQTDVVMTMEQHPIDRLWRAGISVGINTDARTISKVTLTEEYQTLKDHFGWGLAEFKQCNLEALSHAFIGEELKSSLREKILDAYP